VSRHALRTFLLLLESDSKLEIQIRISRTGSENGNPDKVETNKEILMKTSTQNEIEGNLHEAKGSVKEKAGQVTNNPDLTADGQAEKLSGEAQKKVGQIEAVSEK
jgi:uncharacterized protein YjbJ (UPF0337 family)